MARLTNKQRVFVEEYLQCWNATEAARRAGYKHPNVRGPENVVKRSIQAKIAERLAAKVMDADEVLARLGDQARGDVGDFLFITSEGFRVDLSLAEDKTHLLKKVRSRTVRRNEQEVVQETTIELYSSQVALEKLGRHLGLFVDKVDVTSKGEQISGIAALTDEQLGVWEARVEAKLAAVEEAGRTDSPANSVGEAEARRAEEH